MEQLTEKYNALWSASLKGFKANDFTLDPKVLLSSDHRRGLSLVAKISGDVSTPILDLLEKAKAIEPEQYYYSSNELHLTILSLISCSEHFALADINVDDYLVVLEEALKDIAPFLVHFNGLTASSSCVMLQGFPANNTLLNIRNNLRAAFSKTNLRQTIDQRYVIDTAHSTVIRFSCPMVNNHKFIELLEQFRGQDFGILPIKELHLVYNDWYHKEDKTIVLSKIKL